MIFSGVCQGDDKAESPPQELRQYRRLGVFTGGDVVYAVCWRLVQRCVVVKACQFRCIGYNRFPESLFTG